jgi:hypothetical protein
MSFVQNEFADCKVTRNYTFGSFAGYAMSLSSADSKVVIAALSSGPEAGCSIYMLLV